MEENYISIFKAPLNNSAPCGNLSLEEIYAHIKSQKLCMVTDFLRVTKNKKNYLVEKFPYACFSGVLSGEYSSNKDTIRYNGYVALEFEGIPTKDDMEACKRHLLTCGIPTHLLYRSALGRGFVWIVRASKVGDGYHRAAYAYAKASACKNSILKDYILDYKDRVDNFTFVCQDDEAYYVKDAYCMDVNGVELMKFTFDNYPMPKKIEDAGEIGTIPDKVYNTLPDFFKGFTSMTSSDRGRDVLLLGGLTSVSSVIPNVFSLYKNKRIFTNLYFILLGNAGVGKGDLSFCKELVDGVKNFLNEEKKKPGNKYQSSLFIPGNISSAALYESFLENDGNGFMYVTECDTMSSALKTDYCDYSDMFRMAFHHEEISKKRKTGNNKSIYIEQPKLTTLISGTPNQLIRLIPSSENGLFSRFMYYKITSDHKIKDFFWKEGEDGDNTIRELSSKLIEIYKFLSDREIEIRYTISQRVKLITLFQARLDEEISFHGEAFESIRIRLIIIFIRISSIFTVLRNYPNLEDKMYCSDEDFSNAVDIVEVISKHAAVFFEDTPSIITISDKAKRKEKFYDSLPENFTRVECRNISEALGIPYRTMEKYLAEFIKEERVSKVKKAEYKKSYEQTI